MSGRVLALILLLSGLVWTQSQGPLPVSQQPRPKAVPSSVPINQGGDSQKAQKPDSSDPCIADQQDNTPPRLRRGKPGESDRRGTECVSLPVILDKPENEGPREGAAVETRDGVVVEVRQKPQSLLEKVADKSETYSESLPNFICEQLIRRYQTGVSRRDWNLKDTVQVEVMYVDGKEQYKNARHNGKAVKYEDTQKTGTWSEGEYGTVLRDIMHPSTNAQFRYRSLDTIGGVQTEVHDLTVEKANSHWNLNFGGQSTRPKYKGAIWVDPKELMVRRIEMESLDMSPSFPVSKAEMTLEYGPAKIGDKFYILPSRSENLACFSGTRDCVRNEIEFRNYRKFAAESVISTTDTNISFDGEDKKTPPKKK